MRIIEAFIGKEVLNVQAEVVGRVKDLEVNLETNEIVALIVGKGGVAESLGFSSGEVVIPCEMVKEIGDKILLRE